MIVKKAVSVRQTCLPVHVCTVRVWLTKLFQVVTINGAIALKIQTTQLKFMQENRHVNSIYYESQLAAEN